MGYNNITDNIKYFSDFVVRDGEEKLKEKGLHTMQFNADIGLIAGKQRSYISTKCFITLRRKCSENWMIKERRKKNRVADLNWKKSVHNMAKDACIQMILL